MVLRKTFKCGRKAKRRNNNNKNIHPKKAPIKDFNGDDIFNGDIIIHPSGEDGIVIYDKRFTNPWRVIYSNGDNLWLAIQVDIYGQAIVQEYCKSKRKE